MVQATCQTSARVSRIGSENRRRARRRPEIVEFPEPTSTQWQDLPTFHEALDMHMRRHREGARGLRNAVAASGDTFNWTTIRAWRRGQKQPQSSGSFELLARIEARYRLPNGYFRSKLSHAARAVTGSRLSGVKPSERRRLIWHIPDDFDRRPHAEQQEILSWVRRVIISGSTDYRRFHAAAMRDRFALRFPGLVSVTNVGAVEMEPPSRSEALDGPRDAPRQLQAEMADLVAFKTATLTVAGYQRSGVWGSETAAQKIEHLGLLFGALASAPSGRVRGMGLEGAQLTFGLLVFPAVWDWYIRWREQRRGFYTQWEVDMLRLAIAITRKDFGWLRQSPHLAEKLSPIAGVVSEVEVRAAREDWQSACDRLYAHGLVRAKEINRVARVHRDPFEPILPILEADSPVGAYRGITEEIIRRMPGERRYPRSAAESVRSFLMLRLGLHLGVRQKNLRQLLYVERGSSPTADRVLEAKRRGELRWSERDGGWEVMIPATAFKNSGSSYFSQKPFRLVLPDLGRLYEFIDAYLVRHRSILLGGAADPGTFFVKTAKVSSKTAAYDQNTFYEAWRLIIQRYGIYNPYTGRGVIKGLLPHGPHNVRDVLATHILKLTGSYEQASYAIQDTPETVANHYGRFLPQDKAALAAQVLNKVWAKS